MIALHIILVVAGFVCVVKGADFLVEGASALALRLRVPEIVIGLTVVAFGTSLPELVVNVFASANNANGIIFGNIIGSNIFNILLILGISGLIHPLTVQKNTIWKEIPFSLLAVVVLFFLVNDNLFFGATHSSLGRVDALILLILFGLFLLYIYRLSKISLQDEVEVHSMGVPKMILLLILGFAGLVLGGKLVVDNSISIARWLGVSEKLIGLTLVAAGTSLPELATSAVAAWKKRCDIAVGNIVGSNIFNIFLILGISGVVRPAEYLSVLNVDMLVCAAATLVLFITMFTGQKRRLDRWEAALLVAGYIAYTTFIAIRG